MVYVIVYRAAAEDAWTAFQCSSGRFQFDAYTACYRARQIARLGYHEVEVHPIGREGVFCRFSRGETGEIHQEGGVEL